MRLTKYPQSCFKVENNGRSLMIDIGDLAAAKFTLSDFEPFECLLLTHFHPDHVDENVLRTLSGKTIYANEDVASKLTSCDIQVVHSGDTFLAAGMNITAIDLPHCKMVDGSDGPPNTGFLINQTWFHPGDGVKLNDLQVDHVAVAIAGPSISMYTAATFAASLGAKTVIPMHYDNPIFYNDPTVFAERLKTTKVIVLKDAESTEI